jgi:hypothetical protein
MIASAQNAANLRSAERLAAIGLGIDNQNGAAVGSMSYEQRTAYISALSEIIAKNSASFAPATVATAQAVLAKSYSPLQDTSFDWEQFRGLLIDETLAVGAAAASVGEGVKTGLNLTRYLIPAALVVAVAIGLYGLKKKIA